jgi:hypothetical protein
MAVANVGAATPSLVPAGTGRTMNTSADGLIGHLCRLRVLPLIAAFHCSSNSPSLGRQVSPPPALLLHLKFEKLEIQYNYNLGSPFFEGNKFAVAPIRNATFTLHDSKSLHLFRVIQPPYKIGNHSASIEATCSFYIPLLKLCKEFPSTSLSQPTLGNNFLSIRDAERLSPAPPFRRWRTTSPPPRLLP